jgi:hypothetical protein
MCVCVCMRVCVCVCVCVCVVVFFQPQNQRGKCRSRWAGQWQKPHDTSLRLPVLVESVWQHLNSGRSGLSAARRGREHSILWHWTLSGQLQPSQQTPAKVSLPLATVWLCVPSVKFHGEVQGVK